MFAQSGGGYTAEGQPIAGLLAAPPSQAQQAPQAAQQPQRGRVSGWRGFDRVLGGKTVTGALDIERAREQALADAPANRARQQAVLEGMGAREQALFLGMGSEDWRKNIGQQFAPQVIAADAVQSVIGDGRQVNNIRPREFGDSIVVASPDGVRTLATRGPTIAEQTNQERLAFDRSLGNARLGLDYARMQQDESQFGRNLDLEYDKIGSARQERAQTGETNLRKEFDSLPDVKAYREVAAAYDTLRTVAANPSPAGDISLLTGYMKMLDPGSTVREGEFATASNAGGVSDRVRNTYNQMLRGTRLTAEQRQDFVTQAANIYKTRERRFADLQRQYQGLAGSYGADQARVTGPGPGESIPPPPPGFQIVR